MNCPKCGSTKFHETEWTLNGLKAYQCDRRDDNPCYHTWWATPDGIIIKEQNLLQKVLAAPCEKASVCPDANERCRTPIPYTEDMRCIPARRWLDCFSWKRLLGLIFLKDLGVYHLQYCPFCGRNLEEELKRNLR